MLKYAAVEPVLPAIDALQDCGRAQCLVRAAHREALVATMSAHRTSGRVEDADAEPAAALRLDRRQRWPDVALAASALR